MRRPALVLLLLALALAACNGGSSGTPSPSTSTATVAPGGIQSPTTEAPTTTEPTTTEPTNTEPTTTTNAPAGYALELEEVDASGFTTVEMAATTCGSIEGPWNGTFKIHMVTEALTLLGAGPISFTLEPGKTVAGEALYMGTAFPDTDACEIADVSEPLSFRMTLDPFKTSVGVVFGSKAGTSITFVCGDSPPIAIPFAAAWGPRPIDVPISPLGTCE